MYGDFTKKTFRNYERISSKIDDSVITQGVIRVMLNPIFTHIPSVKNILLCGNKNLAETKIGVILEKVKHPYSIHIHIRTWINQQNWDPNSSG